MRCPRCGYEFTPNPVTTKILLRTLEANLREGPVPARVYKDITTSGCYLIRLVSNGSIIRFVPDGSKSGRYILTPIGLKRLVARGLVPPEKEQEYERILRRLIEEWVPT